MAVLGVRVSSVFGSFVVESIWGSFLILKEVLSCKQTL